MEDLPVNGRNWVDLAMMAPGSRLNASTEEPGTQVGTVGVGTFQLNLDGMRITQNQTSGFGQPHYSKDAIAEFQFISGPSTRSRAVRWACRSTRSASRYEQTVGKFFRLLSRRQLRREGLRSEPRGSPTPISN